MTGSPVSPHLYAEVLHFYGRQMQALDNRDFEAFAATFTEDGIFKHSPELDPAQTRPGIVESLHEFNKKFNDDPVQRRHWFNHLVVEQEEDGTLRSTGYALVITTRSGGKPNMGPSCVMNDVLIREEDTLRVQSRMIDHDHDLAAGTVTLLGAECDKGVAGCG
ncbi:MAG: nuclear transport factor 2 family protein [Pseudonocardiaceae bacterium]